jgi:hypothetical protein
MVEPYTLLQLNKKNPTILSDAGLTFSVDWIRATRFASQGEAKIEVVTKVCRFALQS